MSTTVMALLQEGYCTCRVDLHNLCVRFVPCLTVVLRYAVYRFSAQINKFVRMQGKGTTDIAFFENDHFQRSLHEDSLFGRTFEACTCL